MTRARTSAAGTGRPKLIRLTGSGYRWRVIALARVNSLSPSSPWMRPKPLSPTPPKGSAGTEAKVSTELTEVMPLRIRRARSSARALEPENTAPARP